MAIGSAHDPMVENWESPRRRPSMVDAADVGVDVEVLKR
jgi:hypothetical protein